MHLAAYQYHFPLPILFQSPNKQALNLHIHYTVEQIKLAGTGQKPDSATKIKAVTRDDQTS